jgi:iron complex transport system substrate-binding protein
LHFSPMHVSKGNVYMLRRLFLSLACAALLPAQPQRIVSTAPSITEMLYALGLGDRVAGVTRFCRYPPEAQLKPKIGDYVNPNLEAIASLKPDLVIIQTNPVRLRERLVNMHLRTIEVDQQSIAGIYASIRAVGEAAGVSDRAEKLIDSIRSGLDAVHARAAALKPVRVMFVIGRSQGRLDGLVVVGRASYLNEVIRTAGGENVFHDAMAPYPNVSLEEVMARNPEVILDMGDMSDTVSVTEQHKHEVVALWDRVGTVDAVKHHRVFAIASDMYVVPGPRAVDAAQAIFDMLRNK